MVHLKALELIVCCHAKQIEAAVQDPLIADVT